MPYQSKILKAPNFPMQRGSTCGLYALEGIIRVFDPNTKYRATKDHKNPKSDPNWISLRHIAKHDLKITVIGEIFNAKHLKALAEHIGMKAELHTKTDWKVVIRNAINSQMYVIAPFGVNPANGQPQTSGDKAHFCVVFGYAFWNGVAPKTKVQMPFTSGWWSPTDPPPLPPSYAIVRHWNKNHCFLIDEFRKSSQALKKFPKQYWNKQQGTKNLRYDKVNQLGQKFSLFRPSGAKKIPEANLPKTLADQLVVVGK